MMAEGRDSAMIKRGAVLLIARSAATKETMVIKLLIMLNVERII